MLSPLSDFLGYSNPNRLNPRCEWEIDRVNGRCERGGLPALHVEYAGEE